jgi:hypothetical protein
MTKHKTEKRILIHQIVSGIITTNIRTGEEEGMNEISSQYLRIHEGFESHAK